MSQNPEAESTRPPGSGLTPSPLSSTTADVEPGRGEQSGFAVSTSASGRDGESRTSPRPPPVTLIGAAGGREAFREPFSHPGERAIGIILTGTTSDDVPGLHDIGTLDDYVARFLQGNKNKINNLRQVVQINIMGFSAPLKSSTISAARYFLGTGTTPPGRRAETAVWNAFKPLAFSHE